MFLERVLPLLRTQQHHELYHRVTVLERCQPCGTENTSIWKPSKHVKMNILRRKYLFFFIFLSCNIFLIKKSNLIDPNTEKTVFIRLKLNWMSESLVLKWSAN